MGLKVKYRITLFILKVKVEKINQIKQSASLLSRKNKILVFY